MDVEKIKKLIGDAGTETEKNKYCAYVYGLLVQKNNKGKLKNPWMKHKKEEYLSRMFVEVASDGLIFDGENITLQNIGVSYNYQAYKNKMLLAYPESIIDIGTVHGEDVFSFKKDSGKVFYTHDIVDAFNRSELNLKGVYCIIKNQRGEFLTLLSKKDIDKHRSVAKTDYIWQKWYLEMVFKTAMKKGCKQHFNDIFVNIERIDNENYDLTGKEKLITEKQVNIITDMINNIDADESKILQSVGAISVDSIKAVDFQKLLLSLQRKKA
jgi:hypothetical protein